MTHQQRLIDTAEADDTTIETTGRIIKPAFELPLALVDECKLHVTGDGLSINAVDPANVGMVGLTIHPAGFDTYDHAEAAVIGTDLDLLTDQLKPARIGKRNTDDVTLTMNPDRTVTQIHRGYGEHTVTRRSKLLNLDPDSIRDEPDPPDLDYDWRATIDTQAFVDVVEHINTAHDHVHLAELDGGLHLAGANKPDQDGAYIEASDAGFEDAAEAVHDNAEAGVHSFFSMDYMRRLATALHKAKVDAVTLTWAEEWPVLMEFERTVDDAVCYEGHYFLAPRIQDDD